MRQVLKQGRVLTDAGWVDDRAVLVRDGRIEALVRHDDARCSDGTPYDLGGALLLPGFIDTQVNGGGGILFNDDPSVATIEAIGQAHRRFGTTSFLPTLISDDLAVVARAIAATRAAIAARVPGVIGVHVEGPFLNEVKKGVHDADKFRDPSAAEIALLSSLANGKTLVTLAPEMIPPATIATLVAAGVVVSAGHSDATYEQIESALANGLTGFTHLFNAMSQMSGREPGVVGAALMDRDSFCGVIVDGRHVHPAMLKLALRTKRRDRIVLVTDAMPSVGAEHDSFLLQGRTIRVVDGVCVDEHGTLAGSAIDMASAVRNAVGLLEIDLAEAVRMASSHPAEFLGLGHEIGHIAPGYRANLVVATESVEVLGTWIDGEYRSS